MATTNPILSWKIEEYVHREKNPDWFWALGVIAIAGAAIAVVYHDPLFALFIIIGACILGYYAAREPKIIDIAITEEGIQIKDSLYAYKKLKGFSIDEHKMGNQLMIESDRIITPLISIPLPSSIEPTTVIQILEGKVPHKEDLKEHPTHRIMEHIGF